MPFDALVQREGQFGPFFAPAPAGGKFRDDRVGRVLRLVLLEHDEIVEHAHHRPVHRQRRFLEHRHAGRAVEMADLEDRRLAFAPMPSLRTRTAACSLPRARENLASSSASCSLRRPKRPAIASLPAVFGFRAGGDVREVITYRKRGTGIGIAVRSRYCRPASREAALVEPSLRSTVRCRCCCSCWSARAPAATGRAAVLKIIGRARPWRGRKRRERLSGARPRIPD